MLKAVAEEYILLGIDYEQMNQIYYLASQSSAGDPSAKLSPEELEDVRTHLLHLVQVSEQLGMPVAQELLSASAKSIGTVPKSSGEFEILWRAVIAELRSKLFVFVPPHRAKYYEPKGFFSDQVIKAFPQASKEMHAAADCFALEQFTASVFHSMRAAEIGVRALASAVGATFPHPLDRMEWQPILNGIQGELTKLGSTVRTPARDADLQFYAEASAQFRFFKDGWRIHVAHARETYTESQALEVLEHARSFFEQISARLSE